MAIDDVKEFLAGDAPHFSRTIGLKITKCTAELVEGTLEARPDLSNRHGVLHGGAIMTLADTLGGVGTSANLPKGGGTVTIESKTNFFAAVPVGDTARAECTPLAPRPHYDGLANQDRARRRQACGDRHPDPARTPAGKEIELARPAATPR